MANLQPSRLRPQRELYGDVDLRELNLAQRGAASLSLEEHLTEATIDRTIEGASTVTLTLNDYDREILRSGRLSAKADIKIDGLWFRLVAVRKSGDSLTLTFEDREVSLLRGYNKPIVMAWGATTRTKFARRLVREVKETHIEFICPELPGQTVSKDANNRWNTTDAQKKRQLGIQYANFGGGHVVVYGEDDLGRKGPLLITIYGDQPYAKQIDNANRILNVAMDMGARRKLMVCALMAGIQEGPALKNPDQAHSDGDSAGVFQIRAMHGSEKNRRNIEWAARWWFTRAIQVDADHPDYNYGEVAQAVEVSAYPFRYMKWRPEAERLVNAYGVTGGDDANDQSIYDQNGSYTWDSAGSDTENYQFTRGMPTQKNGRTFFKRENSWKCLQRLAQEVNWRCFMVSGALYFISEPWLFRSKPFMVISEETDGVDWIDCDYDTGKPNAQLTVTCHIGRWDCPPGGCVQILDMGPLDGKWLVSSYNRSLFDSTARITLKKPRPRLQEPIQDTGQDGSFDGNYSSDQSGQGDPTQPPAGSGSVVYNAASLANRLLQEAAKGNYRDDNGRQLAQLRKVAAGSKLTNQCKQDVAMNGKVLGALVYLIDRGFKVGTFALVEDHSCNNGQHPKGQAVDISSVGKRGEEFYTLTTFSSITQLLGTQVMKALAEYGAYDLICNGIGYEQTDVQALQYDNGRPRGGKWETDHTNHIHYSVKP